MPTFDPSAEAAALNARIDGPRQSTPVMQPKLAAATPFSPEVRELASELFDRVEVANQRHFIQPLLWKMGMGRYFYLVS